MWWPIRYQWLVPFGSILLAAVAVTSISSAWLAAIERENAAFAELAGGPENLAAIEAFFSK